MKRSVLMTIIALVVMIPILFFLVAIVENVLERLDITAGFDGFTALVCGGVAASLVLALAFVWKKLEVGVDLLGTYSAAVAVLFSRIGSSRVMNVMTGSQAADPVDFMWHAVIPALAFVLAWFGLALPLRHKKWSGVTILLLAAIAVLAFDWVFLYILVPNVR